MRHEAQSAISKTAVLAALVLLFGLERAALAATTWTVHVGHDGTHFADDVSGTNISTIHAGDTVTWVWEGTMQHSVTSGTCDHAGGGGGGGYGSIYNNSCEDGHVWVSTGLQSSGFSFSQTFSTVGTIGYYCMMHLNAMTGKVIVLPAAAAGACVADAHTLCLNSGRFSVTTHWTKPDGSQGDGTGVPLTDDSGYFWFFDPTNIEAIGKVLNGCSITNAYWVFAAGLTNVAVHLTVTDTTNGAVFTQDNAQGSAFTPVQDTAAFPTSCP